METSGVVYKHIGNTVVEIQNYYNGCVNGKITVNKGDTGEATYNMSGYLVEMNDGYRLNIIVGNDKGEFDRPAYLVLSRDLSTLNVSAMTDGGESYVQLSMGIVK